MAVAPTTRGNRIAKAMVSALLIWIALEIFAYVGFQERPEDRNDFGYSSTAGFVVNEREVRLVRAASRQFWPQTYPLHASPGTMRIVLIGDSVLRGEAWETSVAGYLTRQLATCGIAAEVWNLSSAGYGSRRKDVVLSEALNFDPAFVIYHANFTTEYEDAREWERREEAHGWHPQNWPSKLPFLGRVKLSLVEKVFWPWIPATVRSAGQADGDPERAAAISSKSDKDYWIPRMLPILSESIKKVRSKAIPIVLLSRVHRLDGDHLDDYGLDAALQRFALDPGVRVLSTKALLSNTPAPGQLFADSSHWHRAGHELVAQALAVEVLRMTDRVCAAPADTRRPRD
jgi:hypothetical protein